MPALAPTSSTTLPSRANWFEHRSQGLQMQSLQFELSLATADGRSATLRLDHQSLALSNTYTRFGVLQGGPPLAGDALSRMRDLVADATQRQAKTYSMQHSHLQASSSQIRVEGDLELLRDYLSVPATAQRIFDFATGLGRAAGISFSPDAAPFSSFMDQIGRGIAEGFRQATTLLGGLPEISLQTRDLLERMLSALRSGGDSQAIRAINFLADSDQQVE